MTTRAFNGDWRVVADFHLQPCLSARLTHTCQTVLPLASPQEITSPVRKLVARVPNPKICIVIVSHTVKVTSHVCRRLKLSRCVTDWKPAAKLNLLSRLFHFPPCCRSDGASCHSWHAVLESVKSSSDDIDKQNAAMINNVQTSWVDHMLSAHSSLRLEAWRRLGRIVLLLQCLSRNVWHHGRHLPAARTP